MERTSMTRRTFATGAMGTAAVALGSIALSGCSSDASEGSSAAAGSSAGGASYRIGVLQLTQHAALDSANEGFVAALADAGIGEDCIDQQNANNEQSTCQSIADTFVNDGVDLILAIGTPAAQACANATTEIPIVGTAITDFAESGLVDSNDEPGGNITGSSDMNPVEAQIELLEELVPDAEQVGLLYCTAESNSEIQIEMAEEALGAAGIGYTEYTVSSSNEIQSVVEAAVGEADAIYAPTDNTIAAAMTQVAGITNEAGVPTICGESGMVENGGLASMSIDYYELGYIAGEMACQILQDGADPATMPIQTMSADECTIVYNQETADEIGIDVSALADEGGEDVSA